MNHRFLNKKSLLARGFTLIELLVVIGIIAVLSLVILLTLNPAELLRQSRDSNRLTDLSTLNSALALYLTDVTSPNLASSSFGYTGCFLSTTIDSGNATTAARCGVFAGTGITTNVSTTKANYRKINSSGWVPVNFTQVSIGSPFGSLPADPTNNQLFYYAYAASSSIIYELDALLESLKYATNASSDGGSTPGAYEIGTSLNL